MLNRLGRRPRRVQRWFFATDVHGSTRCFRKFLAAAQVYSADVLLLGGDIAGKGIVPIIAEADRYTASFQGERLAVEAAGLESLRERITFNGFYPHTCGPEGLEQLRDPHFRAEVFARLIRAQVTEWNDLAATRLSADVRCIVTPGNDDPWMLDDELNAAERLEFPEGQLVRVGPVQLASLGGVNPTPWHTEREYTEADLADQIDTIVRDWEPEDGRLAFNFHCPPLASGLDTAPELDDSLRPIVRHGQVQVASMGSRAVRDAIRRYQPTVTLHGHIHEAQGVYRIGQTRCFNPGSDYSSGVLKGIVVDLDARGECCGYVFTAG